MTDDHEATGRQAVRDRLLLRCAEAGLGKPRGLTVEAFGRMQGRLVDRLDHMTPENLDTLAELVIDQAGAAKPLWPAEATVLFLAKALQPRPFGLSRIVTSWLASVEGPIAEAEGWVVELYRHLRTRGTPPGKFDVVKLREEAQANRRAMALIQERQSRGSASQHDLDWAGAYERDRQAAAAIVAAGVARRDERGNSDAA
jgi:hypothetical protein